MRIAKPQVVRTSAMSYEEWVRARNVAQHPNQALREVLLNRDLATCPWDGSPNLYQKGLGDAEAGA